jgi:hypothetical protein
MIEANSCSAKSGLLIDRIAAFNEETVSGDESVQSPQNLEQNVMKLL